MLQVDLGLQCRLLGTLDSSHIVHLRGTLKEGNQTLLAQWIAFLDCYAEASKCNSELKIASPKQCVAKVLSNHDNLKQEKKLNIFPQAFHALLHQIAPLPSTADLPPSSL